MPGWSPPTRANNGTYLIVPTVQQDLRRHILQGAHDAVLLEAPRRRVPNAHPLQLLYLLCNAEIGKHDAARVVHEYVTRLDIAVDNASLVHGV